MFFRMVLIVVMTLICACALFLLSERRSGDVDVKLRIGGIHINTFHWSLLLCAAGSLWLVILLTYPTIDIWCGVGVCVLFLCASAIAFLGGHGEVLETKTDADAAHHTIIVGFRISTDGGCTRYQFINDSLIFDDEENED